MKRAIVSVAMFLALRTAVFVRFSSKSGNEYNQQYMSILRAGQSGNDLPEHKLVTTRNRSGLWKMKIEVINIFIMAESTFKSMLSKSINKIDSKEMVSSLLENTSVLADFVTTRNQADQVIKKEVAMNLLEDILSLYIQSRTFSYVKDKQPSY